MALLDDLQHIASHLSPSDFGTSDPLLGALVKVLEHDGTKAPAVNELLPEDHPSQISPPAPAAGQPAPDSGLGDRLSRIEDALGKLLGGHSSSEPGAASAGPEVSAPSSEPASASPDAPELDRP